jgi:hypothetical protein
LWLSVCCRGKGWVSCVRHVTAVGVCVSVCVRVCVWVVGGGGGGGASVAVYISICCRSYVHETCDCYC